MSGRQRFRQAHDYRCWCGQRAARVFCAQMFGRHHFVVLECCGCRTQRILPRALIDQASAQTLYNEPQRPEPSASAGQPFPERMLKRLADAGVGFAPGQRVLDAGCGNGLLLERICEQFGCSGRGIDVDRRRIAEARARSKHATFECGLFDAASAAGKYDVLLANAVIEHVVDPLAFLKQIELALVAGGSLFLLTPNARSLNYRLLRSWWRNLLSIGQHIFLFTPESLERCASEAGFKLVRAGSDFDWAKPKPQWDSLRNCAVSFWAWYCLMVRHLSARLASRKTGDILYAHFRKA